MNLQGDLSYCAFSTKYLNHTVKIDIGLMKNNKNAYEDDDDNDTVNGNDAKW